MDSELLELKNLGNTTIHWLRTIGVNSKEDLSKKGAVAAYLEIKQRGIRVSKVLLYALHGALVDQPWNDLDQNTKDQLLAEAECCSQQTDPA